MRTGRLWLAVGAVVALAIIGVGWLIGASPLLATAAENERQTAEIQAQNAAQEIEIALMREQFENIDELRAELDRLQLSVPGFADTAAYFDELAAEAGTAAVSLQSVTVAGAQPYGAMGSTEVSGEDAQHGEAPTNASSIPAPATPGEDLAGSLYVLTVDIAVDADATQLAAFLDALQGDGRLTLVTNVQAAFGTSQRSTITGHIFVVHDPRLGPVGALPEPEETDAPEPETTATPDPGETGDATPAPTGSPTPAP